MEDKHCPGLDIKLYSVILEKCLKTLGLPNSYSAIGGGQCGKAFLVNGRVYKISTDKSEAVESSKLIGKRNSHIADIYDVKQIHTTLTNTSTFLVVLEHLRTDRDAIFHEMQEELMNVINDEIGEHLFDILYYYRFRPEYYNQVYKPEVDAVLQQHQREKYYYDSLLGICDELKKNNIESLDLQYHNLGLKQNGNLAFFDLGFGEQESGRLNTVDIGEQIVERIMTNMKGASAVKVKKKCQLGGNGDGTSTACNQGDINALDIKKMDESIHSLNGDDYRRIDDQELARLIDNVINFSKKTPDGSAKYLSNEELHNYFYALKAISINQTRVSKILANFPVAIINKFNRNVTLATQDLRDIGLMR